jgi:hypothetical protein
VREFGITPTLKTKLGTKIRTTAMINSGCTHTCIGEKMVKKENIPTRKLVKSMTARNADGLVTGNKQITDFVEVEMEVNGHKEDLEAVVMPLDSPGLLLGHDWLTYHNLEIDWSNCIMKFKNCPETCKFPHNDIPFPHMRRLKADMQNSPEEKKANPTNPEDLPSYI